MYQVCAACVTRRSDAAAQGSSLLVRSACSSDIRTARILLTAEPTLARHDLATACVTGEAEEVRGRLARDPAAVHRKLAPAGWEPLLYACFSRFLRASNERARGIIQVVRILLAAGADPNVCWYDGEFRELPIYAAAGIANSPELTRMLGGQSRGPGRGMDQGPQGRDGAGRSETVTLTASGESVTQSRR